MSTRTFFDIRNVIPGYTFLLFIFLLFQNELNPYFKDTVSQYYSLVFIFLYIFNGIPIGFIINQIFYFLFENILSNGNYGSKFKPNKFMRYLHGYGISTDKIKSLTVIDYLYNNYNNKGIKGYIERRIDIYKTLGSLITAVFISFVFRVYFMKGILADFDKFLLIIGLILSFTVFVGMKRIKKEHEEMVYLILNKMIKNKEWLELEIPEEYFNK